MAGHARKVLGPARHRMVRNGRLSCGAWPPWRCHLGCCGAGALLGAGAATLAGANLAVSVLLYRTDEEAGATLAAAAALWFASATAVLQAATKLALSGGVARLLRSLRLWHVAMALGSCVFVAKARSKDRLFAQSEELLGRQRGAALPLPRRGQPRRLALTLTQQPQPHPTLA